MRKVLFLAAYLVVMAVVGFFLIPRFTARPQKANPTPFALVTTPTHTTTPPPAAPTPLPVSTFASSHLVIPTLKIDSAWTPLGYLSDGLTMASPVGPQDLGWYDFSDQPGGPSNTIFSGHVDWYTGAPAIFRGIATLKEGDEIDVSREDGRLRAYHVVALNKPDQNADATEIIAPTDVPTITLITCVGDWNPVTHEYSNRLVVVATAPKGG